MYAKDTAADLTATFRKQRRRGNGTKLEGIWRQNTSVRQTDGTAVIAEETLRP